MREKLPFDYKVTQPFMQNMNKTQEAGEFKINPFNYGDENSIKILQDNITKQIFWMKNGDFVLEEDYGGDMEYFYSDYSLQDLLKDKISILPWEYEISRDLVENMPPENQFGDYQLIISEEYFGKKILKNGTTNEEIIMMKNGDFVATIFDHRFKLFTDFLSQDITDFIL